MGEQIPGKITIVNPETDPVEDVHFPRHMGLSSRRIPIDIYKLKPRTFHRGWSWLCDGQTFLVRKLTPGRYRLGHDGPVHMLKTGEYVAVRAGFDESGEFYVDWDRLAIVDMANVDHVVSMEVKAQHLMYPHAREKADGNA